MHDAAFGSPARAMDSDRFTSVGTNYVRIAYYIYLIECKGRLHWRSIGPDRTRAQRTADLAI